MLRGCELGVPAGESISLTIPDRSLLACEPQVVSDYQVKVSWAHAPLVEIEPDPAEVPLGIAIDVGTTTVALRLVDLTSGHILDTASGLNRQAHMGDDVLTRINLCATDPAQTASLQTALVEQTLAPLIQAMLTRRDAAGRQVRTVVVAGNTTMLHLLAGADPSPMGVVPFTPVFLEHRILESRLLGMRFRCALELDHAVKASADTGQAAATRGNAEPARQVPVHLLPGAAAYIGADVVAGAFASGMGYAERPELLVDVGTNGEIVLAHEGRLIGCATAAGPAFEGSRLSCGVRAGDGAISRIRLDADPFEVHTGTIGTGPTIGICGSAYVDLLSEARRVGLLTASGRFDTDRLPAAAERIHGNGYERMLHLADGRGREPIGITESDIASLLQAKAAIAAGILTLLEVTGVKPADLAAVHLAGGFGMHMDAEAAIRCGLLPGFDTAQIEVIGNTSLAGAYLAMVDRSALEEMKRLAGRIEVIELNQAPGFEDRYIDQLALP